MGRRDSTKTRVIPVFDHLHDLDRTGRSWLGRLLSLPVGGSRTLLPADIDLTIQDHCWGDDEKMLDPPVALLSWLIRHPHPVAGELSRDPIKAQKRREWMSGSDDCIREGLRLLRKNPACEDWHILEGQTQPDVFIQTPDAMVVIEGKRTEKVPTTSTKWMPGRHQMLRHIDCACEIAGRRKVIGFFIVEGNGAEVEVPAPWLEFARQTVSPEALASSLPHRGPEEQSGIAAAFTGVTTWQRVCQEFGIAFESLSDAIEK